MADEKEVLAMLAKALQQRTDEEEDKDLKTLFREVRDELRNVRRSRTVLDQHGELVAANPCHESVLVGDDTFEPLRDRPQ